MWHTRKDKNINGVGIIIEKSLKNEVIEVKRIEDRISLIKLVLGEETINIISAYAPQTGLEEPIAKILGGHGWLDPRVTTHRKDY